MRCIGKVNKIWFFYFLIKFFYVFFAHYIYSNFSQLGDTDRYYNAPLDYTLNSFYNSTNFMETIGATLLLIFRQEVVASLFVSFIIYMYTYKSLSLLQLSKKDLKLTLLILSLPSICMWTSIWSKESMVFLSFCLISPFFVKYYSDYSLRYNKFGFLLGCYILFLIKPQFLFSVFSVFGYFLLIKKIRPSPASRLIIIFILLSLLGWLYYIFRVEIYELTVRMKFYFITDGASSTRNNLDIFDYQDSFLYNIPYGFYLSFFGPTLSEVLRHNVFGFFYLESLIVFFFICYLYSGVISGKKLKVDFFYIISISLFLIMLAHYPFGVYNPGSAIRYRANFLYYIIFIGLLLKTKKTKKSSDINQ